MTHTESRRQIARGWGHQIRGESVRSTDGVFDITNCDNKEAGQDSTCFRVTSGTRGGRFIAPTRVLDRREVCYRLKRVGDAAPPTRPSEAAVVTQEHFTVMAGDGPHAVSSK